MTTNLDGVNAFVRAWLTLFGEYREGTPVVLDHDQLSGALKRRAFEISGEASDGFSAEAVWNRMGVLDWANGYLSEILDGSPRVMVMGATTDARPQPKKRKPKLYVASFGDGAAPARKASEGDVAQMADELRRPLLGRYLLSEGVITIQQLADAVAWQRAQRPVVGAIAREWHLLTARDVRAVLENRDRTERFCAAAVRAGLLSASERRAIIMAQRKLQKPLGSYFVERGILTRELIDTYADRARGV